jgi:hypothetical protein
MLGLALALAMTSSARAELLGPTSLETKSRLVGLNAIAPAYRPATLKLIQSRPIHIRINPPAFRTTTRVYDYLLSRLSLAATLARTLKVGTYVVEPQSLGVYRATDQRGLSGTLMELVSHKGHVVYQADGKYEGRWIRGITGKALIILRYKAVELEDGASAVKNTIDCLVRLDDPILHGLARLIGSLLQGLMERKLLQAINTARALTEKIAQEPSAVYQAMAQNHAISEAQRKEFASWFLRP